MVPVDDQGMLVDMDPQRTCVVEHLRSEDTSSGGLMDSIYQSVARLEQEGREFAVCTVIDVQGSSPGHTSFKMVVLPDGTQQGTVGGGKLELAVLEAARSAIVEGKSRVVAFDLSQNGKDSLGMLCGGQVTVYIEYVGSRPLLYIYGAGHVGRFLATFASLVGFEVTVLDDRPEFATPGRIPDAHHFLTGDFVELVQTTAYGPQGYHVILTDKHASDEPYSRHCWSARWTVATSG